MNAIDRPATSPGAKPLPRLLATEPEARKTLLSFLAVGSALRIASFFLSENSSGDALSRLALTAGWLQHPNLKFHFDVWLPVHFWLMGALSLLTGDVSLGGRLLSLLLGIASIPAFWVLAEELDGIETAVYASLLFTFYSLQIAYSATSSCDGPYLFFVLIGLAGFFGWRRSGGNFLLCLSAISLTLGSGIRYEAWIIIFALDLILLYRKQWKAFGLFAVVSGLFPGFWMIYEWRTRGNPLYAPALNSSWVAQDLSFSGSSLNYRLLLHPGVILLTLSPLVLIGVLACVRYIVRQKGLLGEFAFIVCFFTVLQMYQIASGGVMAFARYTLTLGTMAALLAGVGLRRMQLNKKLVAGVMLANLAALLILSFLPNPFINKFRSVSPVLRFVPYVHSTGDFLKTHLTNSDAVVIDSYNYETNQLADLAGMSLLEQERAFEIPDQLGREQQREKFAQLIPYLRSRHPRYIVYANRGQLAAYLPLPADCSSTQVEGVALCCVFHNEVYQIYELHY
jgi:hypothetical protein